MKLFFLILIMSFANANDITINISYWNKKEDMTFKTRYENGDTALNVLSKVVKITTADGKYKFVRSIDGFKSHPGRFGWFYLVDGKSTGKRASDYKLNNASSMTWYYKVEQCR